MTFPATDTMPLEIDTMPMEIRNIDTIEFEDHGEGGRGVLIVRQCGEQIALCVSLKQNGDIETLLDREVVERLIDSLAKSVGR